MELAFDVWSVGEPAQNDFQLTIKNKNQLLVLNDTEKKNQAYLQRQQWRNNPLVYAK